MYGRSLRSSFGCQQSFRFRRVCHAYTASGGCKALFHLLVAHEPLVQAPPGHELRVGSLLDDLPVFHDVDAVRALQRGDPVGDDDERLLALETPQVVDDRGLGARVHAGKGVIEDDDGAVLHERAGNRGPLLLARRKA